MPPAFFPSMEKGARGMPSGASPSDTDALRDRLGCPRTAENRNSHPLPPLSRALLLGLAVSSVYRPYARTRTRAWHARAVKWFTLRFATKG
jgi:hypothetical protein